MHEKTLTDWQAAAAKIQIDGRAFLNGQRSDSLSGETRPTMNPANGKKVAEVAYCDASDADQAVKIARATLTVEYGQAWHRQIERWYSCVGLS